MRTWMTYIVSFWLIANINAQQDVLTTQFMHNKLSINPALAGQVETITLTAQYRKQWISFPGAPTSQAIAANFPKISRNIGLGLGLDRHTIGVYERINIGGNYSFGFKLGDGKMALGLKTSVRRYSADFYREQVRVIEGKDKDPSIPKDDARKYNLNAGVGIHYAHEHFYVGASVQNLIRSRIDFDGNDKDGVEVRHVYLMGGYTFSVSEGLLLVPQALLRWTGIVTPSFDANVTAHINKKFWAGISYRSGGAKSDIGASLDFIGGVYITPDIMLSAAYDVSISKLASHNNGSFEVVLKYRVPQKVTTVKEVNPRVFE